MQTQTLHDLVCHVLSEMKAQNMRDIDVSEITSLTDSMIIATGTSSRHVRAMADNVLKAAKAQGYEPIGSEGMEEAEWICVDLGDVIVHLMQPRTRDYYYLEGLWDKTRAQISA